MKIILLLIAVMLLITGADARYSPGLEIAEGENITLDGGYLKEASVLMASGKNITGSGGFITNMSTDYYITPEHFGAVGDNSTDDTDALQDAVDYAYANNCKVMLGPKTYNYTGITLYPGSNIDGISGDDTWQVPGHPSALRYTGTGAAINCTNSTGAMNYKIRLSNFLVIGPGYNDPDDRAGTGIELTNLSEFQIKGVSVKGFDIGVGGSDWSIGGFDDCDICLNTVGVYMDIVAAVSFDGCDFYANEVIYKVTNALNVLVVRSQHELFGTGIQANASSMGDIEINGFGFIGCSINNADAYFTGAFLSDPPLGYVPWNSLWCNITDGGAYHVADSNVIMYKMYYIGNEFRIYKSDYIFEVDLQDILDHGSHAYGTMIANIFGLVNTSVIHTTGAPYFRNYWLDNELMSTPSAQSGAISCIEGFEHSWYGNVVLTGLSLSQDAVYNEGNIWYNPTSHKLEFYNGEDVEVVTSA